MGWIKLDHILLTHPKVFKAPEGFGLYCMSLLYSDHHSTDGFVPDEAIPNLLRGLKGISRLRNELVAAGLWTEAEGGVEIYNYLKHNRSADEVAELKAKRAAAGSLGASKRQANTEGLLKRVQANAKQEDEPRLNNVQADKTKTKTREEKTLKDLSQAAPDDLPRFEDFFREYPRQPNGTKPEPKQAKTQWDRLKADDRRKAYASLPNYRRHLEQNDYQSPKHAFRYLKDRSFEAYEVKPLEVVGNVAEDPDEQARRLVARAGL